MTKSVHIKTTSEILAKIRVFLHSKTFLDQVRLNQNDFIRKRILTMPVIFLYILSMLRKNLSVSLTFLSERINLNMVTKFAFSKARKKMSHKAFVLMNDLLVK